MGADAVSSLTLEDGAGSSCTLGDYTGLFCTGCEYFLLLEILGGRVEDFIQFLSWSIPLFSMVVFNFSLRAAINFCVTCETSSSGVTVGYLIYLCLNYNLPHTLFAPVSLLHTL